MCNCHRLNPVALGMAIGIIWGVSLLIIGLIATGTSYGHPFISAVATVYIGYAPTVLGSLIGFVIGLVDGFIDGFIIGWLYNVFAGCCKKNCSNTCSCCNCNAQDKNDDVPGDTA